MKRQILLICTLFFSLNIFAQSNNQDEIVVEVNAKMKVKPDLVIFTLSVSKKDTTEKLALQKLNKEIDDVIKNLNRLGFTDSSIKISDYGISSNTNNRDEKYYSALNILKVEFAINTKLINALFAAFKNGSFEDLDISYETFISQTLEKTTLQKLIQLSILDAKQNAENICKALGIKTKRVKQIVKDRYNSLVTPPAIKSIQYTSPVAKKDSEVTYNTSFEKFDVEEKEMGEHITIVYEISK